MYKLTKKKEPCEFERELTQFVSAGHAAHLLTGETRLLFVCEFHFFDHNQFCFLVLMVS